MSEYSVSIIIPNFNGEEILPRSLPFIVKASNNPVNRVKEIIVVDDGSKDNSVKIIKDNFPTVRLIKHTQNRGFSASINTGVRMSKGSLVLLLNTDVIPSENFLASTFKHFDDEKVFAVSLHEKGYGYAKGNFKKGFIELSMGNEINETHKSFYVSGGSGIFKREYWMKLSGMDEKLFSPFYWEDLDICYRAEKRGYVNLWEPDSVVEHKHESTITKFPEKYVHRIRERNELLMIWKNIHSTKLFRNHMAGIIKRMFRHPGYLRIILMSMGKLPMVIKKRKKEIKLSKVSDEAVFMNYR